jgi:hypothetical protein
MSRVASEECNQNKKGLAASTNRGREPTHTARLGDELSTRKLTGSIQSCRIDGGRPLYIVA